VTDLGWTMTWLAVLVAGVVGCLGVRALGLASTYVRDLLHVGAGVWVIGWPWWHGAAVPVAIVGAVALATALVPAAARRVSLVARFERSVSGGDERWGGLVLYTLAYASLTWAGLRGDPFPAAAGLWALSLGDGVGGAVGRRFGHHHYRAPGGKQKSLEGTLAVFAAATAGVWLAAHRFGAAAGPATILGLGALAAAAEAAAPRGTDNAVVPATVFAAARLIT
jgi:dolichol kinase